MPCRHCFPRFAPRFARSSVRVLDRQILAIAPVDAENWISHMEKIFDVMGCEDAFKTRLAVYKFEGNALSWWKAYKQAKGGDVWLITVTWADFKNHRNHGHNNDRHGSDRRGGSDNHRSSNNNYCGSNNRSSVSHIVEDFVKRLRSTLEEEGVIFCIMLHGGYFEYWKAELVVVVYGDLKSKGSIEDFVSFREMITSQLLYLKGSADIARITRKEPKPDKNGHDNGKSTQSQKFISKSQTKSTLVNYCEDKTIELPKSP
nr:zinc finger, CCHC-type, retrotransposon Gag domain protein [Tanacetum cinerariifolium]